MTAKQTRKSLLQRVLSCVMAFAIMLTLLPVTALAEKVTDGTWNNSWGDNDNNYTFVVTSECDVTVTFDSNTKTVSVTGENVTKKTSLNVERIVAVGNGSWLNGVAWDPASDDNKMTKVSEASMRLPIRGVCGYQLSGKVCGQWRLG